MKVEVPDIVDKTGGPSSPRKGAPSASFGAAAANSNSAIDKRGGRNVRTVVQKADPASSAAPSKAHGTSCTNGSQSPRPKKPTGLNNTTSSLQSGTLGSSTKSAGLTTSRITRSAPGTRRTLANSQKVNTGPSPTTTRVTGIRSISGQARHADPNGTFSPRAMSPIVRSFSPMHIPSQSPGNSAPNRLRIGSTIDYKNIESSSLTKQRKSHKATSDDLTIVESKRVNQKQNNLSNSSEPYKVVLTQSDPNEIIHAVYHQNRRGMRVVCMFLTRYSVLRLVAKKMGYVVEESLECLERYTFYMCWSDTVLSLPALVRFSNWQRSNHFPSMYLLCRKGHLGATLTKLHNLEPHSYRFYPRTWLMRTQKEIFRKVLNSKEENFKYFIMKPNSGCQGRGIVVTKNPFNTNRDLDNYIVQEYIRNPLLLEGRKFDLRVYVLLTSIREPSIFIFDDGLVRICTDPYETPNDSNVRNACKHLTNYAVNKKNPNFVFNTDMKRQDVGNKRNFKFFNGWLEKQGHPPKEFWSQVGHVITKTILAAQPQLANVYNSCFPIANEGYSCFEVLGFDILVDEKMKPWLLEVNHTPSFATETPLDMDIKSRLLTEVWDIIDIQPADWEKDMLREQYEYTRRSLPPWAKNHPIYSKHLSASSTAAPSTRRDAVVINPSHVPLSQSANPSNPLEVPQYVVNRRVQEDSKLRGFARVYPSSNSEFEKEYQRIRLSALQAWSAKQPPELKPEVAAKSMGATPKPLPNLVPPPQDPEAKSPRGEEEPVEGVPNKSMSRPMPTQEELKWLQDLQEKLDALSEKDPNAEDLQDDIEE